MFLGRSLTASVLALSTLSLVSPVSHHRIASGTEIVGAFPAPVIGPGPGTLASWTLHPSSARTGYYGQAKTETGNSFFVGYSSATHSIYVPTFGGTTYILNSSTLNTTGEFPSLAGGRIGHVVPQSQLLLVMSGSALAAYSLKTHQELFTDPVGGNALVTSPNGQVAYVGGNMDKTITAINLHTGQILNTYPVPQIGDMVWARGQIFAADIQSGVMTALNPRTDTITTMATPEVDSQFSYTDIPAATAGFMQLAVGPHHNTVYAAGFSGHILEFSASKDKYLGEVAINANTASGGNKLSGLAILPGGNSALVTVENLDESVVVNLSNGAILHTFPKFASNRWLTIP
ncbi:MAG: PQQ-binding-like beta-propeller repeat protein [Sulfobacillus sp.]